MLLTLSTTHAPATDLGYLLHKHPDKLQSFELSFGRAHVFYLESHAGLCTAALLLDVDPVGMVRGKQRNQGFLLAHYVNDRPYVASSFLSVAIAQVFGTALSGRCKDRPELAATPLPFTVRIEVLPVRGDAGILQRMFGPLGYTVEATRHPLDERFPEWGESPYYSVTLRGTQTLAVLLTHLYVLVPVFDNEKHYFVGNEELEKLLARGEGWLATHPEKDQITRRYLRHQSGLYREALARLIEDERAQDEEMAGDEIPADRSRSYDLPLDSALAASSPETGVARPEGLRRAWFDVHAESAALEVPPTVPPENATGGNHLGTPPRDPETILSLNDQRHGTVLAALRGSGARSVLDLGCSEGKLLQELIREKQFERIVGLDVSIRSLEIAQKRLKLDRLSERQAERIKLLHGSLMYRDPRLANFDAAAVVEVIEHLDPPRLAAFERVLFEFARPQTVVLTTPNREYNVKWETLPAGRFRHADHRFEWTRQEFQDWVTRIARQHAYTVRFVPIGPVDETLGPPTQMAVFRVSK